MRQDFALTVPTRTVKVQPTAVRPVLRFLQCILCRVFNEFKIKRHGIDWNGVFSGKVLFCPGQKGRGKKQTTQPKHHGGFRLQPLLHERQPGQQVGHVRRQRFQTGVGREQPQFGHLAVIQTVAQTFQFVGHHHHPFDGFLNVVQGGENDGPQGIEPVQLLRDHGVHGFFPFDRVPQLATFHVKQFGNFGQIRTRHFQHNVVSRTSPPTFFVLLLLLLATAFVVVVTPPTTAVLGEQNAFEQ